MWQSSRHWGALCHLCLSLVPEVSKGLKADYARFWSGLFWGGGRGPERDALNNGYLPCRIFTTSVQSAGTDLALKSEERSGKGRKEMGGRGRKQEKEYVG